MPSGPVCVVLASLLLGLTPTGPSVPDVGALIAQQEGPVSPALKGTASIKGVVTAADTGQPVNRAHVTLTAPELPSPLKILTDEEGRYAFSGLGAGRYTVSATKSGYFEAIFGQKVPPHPGTPVSIVAGQMVEHVDLQLPKGGVIAGQIVDEHGNPVPDTQVHAMRRGWRGSERQLGGQSATLTDDRGQYRLHNLPPGTYLIQVVPRMDMNDSLTDPAASRATTERLDYPKLFFPGTINAAEATGVTVGLGEERQGIDIRLQLVPMAKLSGTFAGLEAKAQELGLATPTIASFGIVNEDVDPAQPFAGNAGFLDGDHFHFDSVPPGRYTIQGVGVSRPPGSGPLMGFWGSLAVVVDGHDQDQLTVAMQTGSTMTGRLTKGPSALGAPPLDQMQVHLTAPAGGVELARVTPDATGRFAIQGVVPGAYVLTVSGPGTWTAASEIVAGKDALDFGLVIRAGDRLDDVVVTLTDRSTEVRGTLLDAKGQTTSGYTVVVFAADPGYWVPSRRRIQATRPSTDGAFRVTGLAPGDYFIAVATDIDPSQLYEPALLQELKRGAIPLHLVDGDRKEQVLRIGGMD